MDFDVIPYEDIVWGDRIGGGSFGSVFRGQYLGIDVAAKEIHESTQYDVQKYFEREWRIMRECRHPNIVLFLGLSREPDGDNRIFIISEYVPSGNLRSFLRSRTPFPWRLRISFATDVARAVAYLHARHCIHRDLKGENILITSNNRIKVADFGFARITGRNDEELKHMTYCGTDGYMSPEIIMGEAFDLPTDVYSLGIILIEILTRVLVGSKVYSRPPPIFVPDDKIVRKRSSPGCPPDFLALALECCRFSPDERPKMSEVLARLRKIEADLLEDGDFRTTHPGSIKIDRREGKRAMPIFDVSMVSDLAAAERYSEAGSLEADCYLVPTNAVTGAANDDRVPLGTRSVPWDEMTSHYTTASEMHGWQSFFVASDAKESPKSMDSCAKSPASDMMDSTVIFKVSGSQPSKAMPCAYPPSPPYTSDETRGPDAEAQILPPTLVRVLTPEAEQPPPDIPACLPMPLHRFSVVLRQQPAFLSVANLALAFLPRPIKDKCSVCIKRLGSKTAMQCDDCGMFVHPKCSSTAPRNCVDNRGVDV